MKLGVWTSNARARRDKLTQEQLDALRELGMDWAVCGAEFAPTAGSLNVGGPLTDGRPGAETDDLCLNGAKHRADAWTALSAM